MSANSATELFIAAAVQRAPVYGDLQAGVKLAVASVREAAKAGARLIVFPESWLPGFPYWCTEQRPAASIRGLFQALTASSVEIPGPELEAIGRAAKRRRRRSSSA